MGVIKKKSHYKVYSFILIALLVVSIFAMMAPPIQALAADDVITISGPGLNNPESITITQEQLCGEEALPSELQEVYGKEFLGKYDEKHSTINTDLEVKEPAVSVTLEINPARAKIGDEIALDGDADPNTFVLIKVVDSKGNIVYFDAVKSDSNGKYNTTFIVPDVDEGELTIVAGYGTNVAVKILKVIGVEPETYTLTLEANPTAGGTVTGSGDYAEGAEVEITAEANEGYKFINWTIDGEELSTDASFTYTIPANDVTLVANFEEIEEPDNPLLSAPELKSDTTDNFVGKPIELTFTDDEDWRKNIIEVYVDNQKLQQDNDYEIDVGVITISTNFFTSAGDYTIVVRATDYQDATVTQTIKEEGTTPDPIEDGDIVLTITGDGVAKTKTYTQSQLEEMPQIQRVYSCVNTWPTKQWYVGKGVALSYLLGPKQADIKSSATLIRFTAGDGYYMTLTVEELLEDNRYRFPNFKTGGDGDGHIPGSTKGAVEVETILALTSAQSDNPSYMNELNALHLMPGQRAVTEQTGPLFVKNVNKIEVLTKSIPKWDAPKAEPGSGTVPAGTEVRLNNKNMDQDKIHYTTDGSTPTLDSPIYNWVAKRWWSARGDETVEKINHPIEITEDTTIKAVTIGPGKKNSDVITFTYKVTGAKPDIPDISEKIKPSEGGAISLGDDVVIMEIPAGALTGTGDLEVKIERVKEPPAVPAGFKLLSDVFEFSIDGKQSYDFAKKVKIKLGFDPKALDQVETPAIYYYDEVQSRWEEIEGIISDNTITIEIDHFTKFAIMAPLKSEELQFDDIIDHWAQDNIKKLVALGAINGYPDNSFKPDNNITRAEFTTVLIRTLELPSQNGKVFADTADHWARDMISTAAHHGIVNGYDDNTFGPNDHITREQMAVMIIRVAELAPEEGELSFTDNDRISDWARSAMATAVKNEIINGYPDNTIRPQGLATRAEAVTIIVREMDRREK